MSGLILLLTGAAMNPFILSTLSSEGRGVKTRIGLQEITIKKELKLGFKTEMPVNNQLKEVISRTIIIALH